MRAFLDAENYTRWAMIEGAAQAIYAKRTGEDPSLWLAVHGPLPNVWLGVSVESAAHTARIDILRGTPAAVKFLSLEPLLGPLPNLNLSGIDWVIVGGESGHHARPCDVSWIRRVVAQCGAAGVPCFVKQLGARPVAPLPACAIDCGCGLHHGFTDPKGGDPKEWPAGLRAREFPKAAGAGSLFPKSNPNPQEE